MGIKSKVGIYKITNKENGLIYIGSSKNINKRWKDHINQLSKSKHPNMYLQEDWDIYGKKSFEFSILEECKLENQFELEQKYINKLKPFYRNNKGYNIAENARGQNDNELRIFKDRYFMQNPFYKMSEKNMLKLYNEEYSGELHIWEINNKSKVLWYDLDGAYYIIKPIGGRAREISSDEADNMTRDELISYCEAMDTYDMLKDMAIEGYMDIDDWV